MTGSPQRNVSGHSPEATPAAEMPPLIDRDRTSRPLRWLMHLGVPAVVSLSVHVFVLALLTLRTMQVFVGGPVQTDYEVSIAEQDAGFKEELQWPGEHALDIDPAEAAAADPFALSGGRTGNDLSALAAEEISINPGEIGTGGFGIGESGRSGVLGLGGGAGGGGGAGLGAGFGTGSGIGQAGVWSVRASGDEFAYVVDFSGSILLAVDELKHELKRSIGNLKAEQSFTVFIFYSVTDRRSEQFRTDAFSPTLREATPEVKEEFFAWIDRKQPRGSTEPLQAMRRALALEPDAVFFFSDGLFGDEVVTAVAGINQQAKAQIHCLVFDEFLLSDTSGLPRMTEGARRLKRIADATGGKTKIVTGADLQGR